MQRILSNRRWRWLILIVTGSLVLSGLIFAGWAIFGTRTKPADSACPVIIPAGTAVNGQVAIDESYSGQNVTLKSGDQLILAVKYLPSTGYGWSLKEISNPEVLKKVNSIFDPNGV
jgi:hypothetical protein